MHRDSLKKCGRSLFVETGQYYNLEDIIRTVALKYEGNTQDKIKQTSKGEDNEILASVGNIDISMQDRELDTIVMVSPNSKTRDLLLDAAKAGYPERRLECIQTFGADYDKIEDALEKQCKAIEDDLVAFMHEAGLNPKHEVDSGVLESFSPSYPVHPENETEVRHQREWRLSYFEDFEDEDKLQAYENFLGDMGLLDYYYLISVDDGTSFEANVRRILDDYSVYKITAENNCEPYEVSKGYIQNKYDIEDIQRYLCDYEVIDRRSLVYLEKPSYLLESLQFNIDDVANEYWNIKEECDTVRMALGI